MEEKLYICECMESCESSECKYRKPHKNDGDLVCLGSLVDVESYKEMVEAMKMKVRKEKRQAMFYMIENCSSCGLDHIVYERDMHRIINSPDNALVFICPKENTCVEIEFCECCEGTGRVDSDENEAGYEACITCNGSGR